MKYYVVLDTNVVVSALFNISSVPGIILQEALAGRVIPLLHEDILDEYNDVLHRGIFLEAATIEDYVPDPDDAIFYEVVMEARETTDAYLVTGNIKHFPVKPYVVTPKEMLEILNENER